MKKKDLIEYILCSKYNFNGNIFGPMFDNYINNIKNFYENSNLTKLEDYLYYIKYKNIDYGAGKEYFKKYKNNSGGCSVCRKDNLIGRNYDLYYDNQVSFIVETEKTNEHFWSIGMSGGITELDKDFVSQMTWKEIYDVLPNRMLDGINENGVFCEVNIVPNGDMGKTTGTNPKGPSLSTKQLIRFVLDNAESAEDAIDKLKEKNIWAPNSKELNEEYHFMIADSENTFVIEFINNEMVILENQTIMTNFYLTNFNGEKDTLTPNGAGWERYKILLKGLEDVENEEDMINLMKKVYYSNTYNEEGSNEDYPIWFSEFNGDYTKYGFGILTNNSPSLDYAPVIAQAYQLWQDKTREVPNVWHTVHSVVYDLENLKLSINCQEGDIEYTYPISE